MFLVSPTDPELAELLGDDAIVSSLPEKHGSDVLAFTKFGKLGIQRKRVPDDFAASIDDGRLAWELPLLAKLDFPLLVPEGEFFFNSDGRLAEKYGSRWKSWRFTRKQVRSILRSVKWIHGVDWEPTIDVEDTVDLLRDLVAYLDKDAHLSLFRRPGPKGEWGSFLTHSERLRWILQGFEGVGVRQAQRLLDHMSGESPLKWALTEEEMTEIRGIGKPTARKLYKILEGGETG